MEVRAITKYARISPYKVRDVAREIQGLPVSRALDVLRYTPRKAAFIVGKTLRSAIANAENNHDMAADALVIKKAVVGQGPSLRRFKPRARGSAAPIKKRTSHIFITLSDEIELPAPRKRSGVTRKKKIEKRLAMAAGLVKKSKKKEAPAEDEPEPESAAAGAEEEKVAAEAAPAESEAAEEAAAERPAKAETEGAPEAGAGDPDGEDEDDGKTGRQ